MPRGPGDAWGMPGGMPEGCLSDALGSWGMPGGYLGMPGDARGCLEDAWGMPGRMPGGCIGMHGGRPASHEQCDQITYLGPKNGSFGPKNGLV
jgi:hypothetical protein